MDGVFLETTALANLFYKSKTQGKALRESIPDGTPLITSQYVIYELSRGFLRYLILIYNRTTLLTKFSELCTYGNALRRKTYFQGAMWEAFEKYYADAKFESPDHMSRDEYELASFRAFLRRDIRRGWLKQQRAISRVVDEVKCRDVIPAPSIDEDTNQYAQPLKKELCGNPRSCGIKAYMGTHRTAFEQLRESLQNEVPLDEETKKRIRSLRELYRVPNTIFNRNDCYSCGDAIIAHEAPSKFPIATTNQKHYQPLCSDFKKDLLPLRQ